MDNDNTYNGWPNRETWAANLWLNNDEGLYRWLQQAATLELGECMALLREQLTEWHHELKDGEPLPGVIRSMLCEIGSLWRVDWRSIAEAAKE